MSDTTPATGETTETPEGKAPEFEGEFDAEKAQRLVSNLRAEVATLKTERDSLRTERDEFKAAAEKTGEDRDKALKEALDRAEAAERTLAIKKHNLPDDVVEEFADYLTGTAEEVDAKAAKLAARLAVAPKEEPKPEGEQPSGDEGQEQKETPEPPVLPERPKPALTPGHGGEVAPEFDPAAIAKAARRH